MFTNVLATTALAIALSNSGTNKEKKVDDLKRVESRGGGFTVDYQLETVFEDEGKVLTLEPGWFYCIHGLIRTKVQKETNVIKGSQNAELQLTNLGPMTYVYGRLDLTQTKEKVIFDLKPEGVNSIMIEKFRSVNEEH